MSSTVVRDCTPPSGPGDNALVIVMGEDGSLSVDADTLHNILTMGDNTTSVNIVRLSGTDPETETVDVTLDTFFETDVSSSQTMFNSDITTEAETNENSVSDNVDVITRMCENVHMDHCYTPHTSPNQKQESVTSTDSLEPSTSKLKSSSSHDFNSSTEDLVAVLSAFDSNTDNETSKPVQQKVVPKTNIPTVPLKSSALQSVETKLNVGINKLKTLNKAIIPTQTFNKKTNIPLSKKSLKIVTVSKPATSLKSLTQNIPNQSTESIKDFLNDDQLNSNLKAIQNSSKEVFPFKETVDKDDLSDISSDPDYFDDDSADSDFETLHRKSLTKAKQLKKSVVKRGNKINSFRDKHVMKSRASRSKINKTVNNKRISTFKPKIVSPNEKEIKTKVESDKKAPVTPTKNESSLIVNVSETHTEVGKLVLDSAKKIIKKKVQKPVEIFDDGIALFSTPDVIRRVSTSSKSSEILKSSDDKVNESPSKHVNKVTRTLSSDQKSRELSEQNISKQMLSSEILDKDEVLSHRIDVSNVESLNTDLSNSNKMILDQNINVTDNPSQSIIDQNDQNLSNLNYDSANLDLDLNTEELIPEDLLYQVAKLVENPDIQKVIDTNLTLVEQNLPELDPEMSKTTDDDSFSVKEIMTGENLATPSTKDLQKIIGGDLSNVSIVTNMSSSAQVQTRNERLSTSNVHNDQKELTISQGGIITKNNTNKPLQIVRADGRIITIPPIEKPATRSSKKKQEDSDTTFIQNIVPLIQDQKIKKSTYIASENIQGLSSEDSIYPQEEHFAADDADMSDSDESWKSEDDPDRLWCICKQPHNNRFMICCDTCEEWFHGQCVGISKALGRQMEQEGKEWQCPNCQKVKKSLLQVALSEAQAEMPLSPTREVNQEGENVNKRRCIVCKAPSRSESVYCSEKCIVQHSNTVERVVVFERSTGKCLSGNNAPTVANLKQWLKEHPGFEVVSSGNKTYPHAKLSFSKVDKSNLSIKNISNVPSQKQKIDKKQLLTGQGYEQKSLTQLTFYGKQSVVQTAGGKTYVTKPQAIIKQVPKQIQMFPKTAKLTQPHSLPVKQNIIKPKQIQNNTSSVTNSPHITKNQQQSSQIKPNVTPQKVIRQKSISEKTSVTPATSVTETKSPVATKAPEQLRENVRKTLAEQINIRLKEESELTMTEDEVKKLTTVIESELYSLFNKDTGIKYKSRYRSLVFNIKDTKNTTLWRRIVGKSISPKELVRLTPEELASSELAQWREREAKHQLEMIKKSELDLLNCARTYVLKSHKGEEVIEKRAEVDSIIVAELDGSINEDSRIDTGEIVNERSLSHTNSLKDLNQGKDEKDRHRRGSSTSSSTKHRNSRDEKERDKSKESRGKRKDGSRERDRKKRSRSHSKERRSDSSKDKKESKRSRRRSRSGSRARSNERESRRHKDKHRDHNRHKSSSSRHKSNHKDSGSDSTTSKSSHDKVFCEVGKGTPTTNSELDRKSKDTLERLIENKVVTPLEDRLWKHVQEHDIPATCDSESDHEPSSTVMITTPPHTGEQDDKSLVDKFPESVVKGDNTSLTTDLVLTVSQSIKSLPISHLTSADGPNVWEGYINMVDVAKFYITAQEVSGDCTGLSSELPSGLDIVGRISPDTVWDYLSKMRRSTAKHISILRLTAANVEEHMPYHALYTYLSSRKRFGVVKTTDTSIKDFYIMPQASYNPLPQVLLPLNGPGFEESRPHLLLGIIVSSKRKKVFQQTLTETSAVTKKIKESPPRSYTPPPTSGNKDPRLLRQQTILSTVSIMPPLPQVGQSLASLDLPKPPAHDDDMDEPYSPEDSDEGAPNSTILSTVPKSINASNSKDMSSYVPSVSGISYTSEQKQIVTDLSTFEPFKATNFSSIPGLDTGTIPTTGTGSLGVSNFLNTLSATASSSIVPTETLLSSQIASTNLSSMLGTGDFLNNSTFDNGISSIDKTDLQKKMDELNQQIEKQKQEIQNISQGIVGKEDLGSSCLANIALPSNLQQILDSIKTTNSSQSIMDSSQESNDLTKTLGHSLSIPPPSIISNIISTNSSIEEYSPQISKVSSKTANYVPSTSLIQTDNSNSDKVQSVLPTIPLILPKLNTRTETTVKNRSEINLTIPLNLPRPKRSFSAISDGKSDPTLQSIPLNLPKIKKGNSPKADFDTNIKKCDKTKNTDNVSKPSGSVLSTLSEEDLIRKAAEMLGTKPEENESIVDTSPVTPKQTDSVLSSLSEEDLIRKAAEMLGETVADNEVDMKKDDDDDDDDDEPYDPGELQPVSIKQGPVLYTPGQIKKTKFPDVDQPPIPGMEDYEEEI